MQVDLALILSIYAAILSTVVFAWRIYEFRYDRVGKIRVRPIIVLKGPLLEFAEETDELIVLVTNVGKSARIIKIPHIDFKADITNVSTTEMMQTLHYDLQTEGFPKTLEPGEEYQHRFPYRTFFKMKKWGVDKVQIVVPDTHKKLYKSKYFYL